MVVTAQTEHVTSAHTAEDKPRLLFFYAPTSGRDSALKASSRGSCNNTATSGHSQSNESTSRHDRTSLHASESAKHQPFSSCKETKLWRAPTDLKGAKISQTS